MKVVCTVGEQTAIAAMCYHYLDPENKPVTNGKVFRRLIGRYIESYGDLCVDDHQSEGSRFIRTAQAIVNKYFK